MEKDENTVVPSQGAHAKLLADARAAGYAAAETELGPKIAAKITADATAAERTRIGSIIGGEASKGRESLAQHFAFKTAMSVEEATAALEASPKQEAAAAPAKNGADAFAASLANTNPGVAAAVGDAAADSPEALATAVISFLPRKRKA